MKKVIIITLMLVLLMTMQLTASAKDMELTFSDKQPEPGETVYLTVALSEKTMGNSLAVTLVYDETLLEWDMEKSTWSRQGVLQDFGMMKNAGVWTTEQTRNLQGGICRLAFRVKSNKDLSKTMVQCTVVVKNGAEQVGKFTSEAFFGAACNHTYGEWESLGDFGHRRICTQCGAHENQSHNWDNGEIKENPDNPNMGLKVYTCKTCAEQKSNTVDVPPSQTKPTEPEQEPSHTHPTTGGSNRPTEDDHGHTYPTTQPQEDEPKEGPVLLAVIVIVGALSILGGSIAYFIIRDQKTKKKR